MLQPLLCAGHVHRQRLGYDGRCRADEAGVGAKLVGFAREAATQQVVGTVELLALQRFLERFGRGLAGGLVLRVEVEHGTSHLARSQHVADLESLQDLEALLVRSQPRSQLLA